MIRVKKAPPPATFNSEVASPGHVFLRRHPHPSAAEFAGHNYWIRIKGDMHASYLGICAYTCHYIPKDTGHDTVEHFIPKSVNPRLAYDWDNYRLVCGRLNGRKGTKQDIMDPFRIEDGMFALDFPSLLMKPGEGLSEGITDAVLKTIERLKLNDDETCVAARLEYVLSFSQGDITFDYLKRRAPFIAHELERQNIIGQIGQIMNIT